MLYIYIYENIYIHWPYIYTIKIHIYIYMLIYINYKYIHLYINDKYI